MFRSPTLSFNLALFLFSLTLCLATPSPSLQNYTIVAPVGTSDHNNKHLICTPARWTDIAVFFLGNYVAHAATVKTLPGEATLSIFLAMIFALLFPVSGMARGVAAIRQHAMTRSHPLDRALRAGALCMVVRIDKSKTQNEDSEKGLRKNTHHHSSEQPGTGDNIELANVAPASLTESASNNPKQKDPTARDVEILFSPSGSAFFPATGMMSYRGRKVHGWISLPEGFALKMLPPGSVVKDFNNNQFSSPLAVKGWSRNIKSWLGKVKGITMRSWFRNTERDEDTCPIYCSKELSSSYSFTRSVFAVFQTIFAIATLYRTRGDQINRYGYAAFGLTVVPYAIMSVINLISIVLTPDYPAVYLVSSDTMEEARKQDGVFEGVVGKLIEVVTEEAQEAADPNGLGILRVLKRLGLNYQPAQTSSEYQISVYIGTIAIAIIGGISRFKSNHSTHAQRVWTMVWLVWGIMGSIVPQIVDDWLQLVVMRKQSVARRKQKVNIWQLMVIVYSFSLLFTVLIYSAPAIGGFVVVGQMLRSYGSCYRLY